MITAIQGTPGSGKSAVCTVDMLEFLQYGGVVACNYNLVPGWHYLLAASTPKVRWGRADLEEVAQSYHDRAFRVGTQDTCFDLSARLRDILKIPEGQRMPEGSGRLYIDEAQLLFNSRTWKENMGFFEFFTQHRKLGWDVYIVTHALSMIDKQIQGLVEIEGRLRNMQKVKIFGCFRSPVPKFFCIYRYAGIAAGAGSIESRRLYSLNKTYASLYDSMEIFAFDAASVDVSTQGDFEQLPVGGLPGAKRSNFMQRLQAKERPKRDFSKVKAAEVPYCM